MCERERLWPKKERKKETRRDGVIVASDKCGLSRDKQRVNTHNNQSHFLLSTLHNIAFFECVCICAYVRVCVRVSMFDSHQLETKFQIFLLDINLL